MITHEISQLDLSESHLYDVFCYANSRSLKDKSVLVNIARDLLDKNPDIDRKTYAYRLALKFSNYQEQSMAKSVAAEEESAQPQKHPLTAAIEKDNAQTSKEWDAFLARHGVSNYDDYSDKAKAEALALVDRQGDRWNRILSTHG